MNMESILSSVISILFSIIITWIFSEKYRAKKKIEGQFVNNRVFVYDEKIPSDDIKIRYKNTAINQLYLMSIALWNSGTAAITKDDYINSNLLKVHVDKDALLLRSNILKVSNEDCNFKIDISEDRKSAYILFDYLNRKDGICFNILHSSKDNPIITGNFVGLDKELRIQDLTFRKIWADQVILVLTAALITIIYLLVGYLRNVTNSSIELLIKMFTIGAIGLVVSRVLIPPKRKLPSALRYKNSPFAKM